MAEPLPFDSWNKLASLFSYIFWVAGLLILIGYLVRLSSVRDNKDKYDFINKHEINWLWITSIFLIIGACFYGNSSIVEVNNLWIFVRGFVTFAMGMIVGLVVQNLLKFYYPFFIEKRLRELRYQPRISPDGRQMKLLSEEEEDAYLDEGMQAEENVFSVDYDVWKDEVSGYTKVEKYSGHLHAIQCPECNYQTLKVVQEEIIQAPTATEDGQLDKHFKCGYCGHKFRKTVHLKHSNKVDISAASL